MKNQRTKALFSVKHLIYRFFLAFFLLEFILLYDSIIFHLSRLSYIRKSFVRKRAELLSWSHESQYRSFTRGFISSTCTETGGKTQPVSDSVSAWRCSSLQFIWHLEFAGGQTGGCGWAGERLLPVTPAQSQHLEQLFTELSRAETVQEEVDGGVDDDTEFCNRERFVNDPHIRLKKPTGKRDKIIFNIIM